VFRKEKPSSESEGKKRKEVSSPSDGREKLPTRGKKGVRKKELMTTINKISKGSAREKTTLR